MQTTYLEPHHHQQHRGIKFFSIAFLDVQFFLNQYSNNLFLYGLLGSPWESDDDINDWVSDVTISEVNYDVGSPKVNHDEGCQSEKG